LDGAARRPAGYAFRYCSEHMKLALALQTPGPCSTCGEFAEADQQHGI
jgi:hypothetical protein